jgi:acetyl esterase/lipase
MPVKNHPLTAKDKESAVALRAMLHAGPKITFETSDRLAYDAIIERSAAPDNVTFEQGEVGGVPGWWARPAQSADKAVILYMHGGGFMLGSAKAYRGFAGQIAAGAGAPAFIADYGLAPERPFPAAWDDFRALEEGLVELGYERIGLVGDSAGGGLVLSALSQLSAASDRIAGIVALSPWVDLTVSGKSMTTRANEDPILTPEGVRKVAGIFLAGYSPHDWRLNLLDADFKIGPPVLIHVGDSEILLDDSLRFAEKAERAGLDCEVHVWDGMFHVFPTGFAMFEAAAEALGDVGGFLAAVLASPRGRS